MLPKRCDSHHDKIPSSRDDRGVFVLNGAKSADKPHTQLIEWRISDHNISSPEYVPVN